MRFEENMVDVGRTVGRLVVRQDMLDGADLDMGLTGHACLIGLLRQLHGDVTGLSPVAARHRSLQDLETRPVALLGRLLREQPVLTRESLGDVLAAPRSLPQQLWADLARHATLAHHEWTSADPRSWPRGDAAWGVMADVGALAEASSHLAHDLAASAASVGRLEDAETFGAAASSGLRVTAREVTTIALSGPTTAAALLPRDPRRVQGVRTADDIPKAVLRAASLVLNASFLGPAAMSQLGVAHARTMLAAADAVEHGSPVASGDSHLATQLRTHAALVAHAARPSRDVASILRDDQAPLAQLAQILQLLTQHDGRWPSGRSASDDALLRYATLAPTLTAALRDSASRQVRIGAWLERRPGDRWRPFADGRQPAAVSRWVDASRHADLVAPSAPAEGVRSASGGVLESTRNSMTLPLMSSATLWPSGSRPTLRGTRPAALNERDTSPQRRSR